MNHVCSCRNLVIALVVAATGIGAPAFGQWSSNTAANLNIANRGSDQNQPKVRPTSDGGCYISWFDGIGSGWDVRLQRLNAKGVEQWPHNGVHLIFVRRDLGVIIHHHPPVGPGGKVTDTVTFPAPGPYKLVIDAYPKQSGVVPSFESLSFFRRYMRTSCSPYSCGR